MNISLVEDLTRCRQMQCELAIHTLVLSCMQVPSRVFPASLLRLIFCCSYISVYIDIASCLLFGIQQKFIQIFHPSISEYHESLHCDKISSLFSSLFLVHFVCFSTISRPPLRVLEPLASP